MKRYRICATKNCRGVNNETRLCRNRKCRAVTCPPLEDFPHLKSIRYVGRRNSTGKFKDANPLLTHGVRAYHTCEPGYEALPNGINYCVGRRFTRWTKRIVCAESCLSENQTAVKDHNITCGRTCVFDRYCGAGKFCACDGPCGRTCVDDSLYNDSETGTMGQFDMANVALRISEKGGLIKMNSTGKIEVYFFIDLSNSVFLIQLRKTISFAKRLVKRLSSYDKSDRVSYGIVVFDLKAKIQMLNTVDVPQKTSTEVINILEDVYIDVEKIRRELVYLGRYKTAGFRLPNEGLFTFSLYNDSSLTTKRYTLVLNARRPNVDWKYGLWWRLFETGYIYNLPEFYSITSSARTRPLLTQQKELNQINSTRNNVHVDDFYKLQLYVNHVTDVREDYSTCGQSSGVGSIRKTISPARAIGGDDAAERAWPWQVLVLWYNERLTQVYLLFKFTKKNHA